jgi:hypothetical protein
MHIKLVASRGYDHQLEYQMYANIEGKPSVRGVTNEHQQSPMLKPCSSLSRYGILTYKKLALPFDVIPALNHT